MAASKKPAPRADLGAPIDTYFAKQSPESRAILDSLRALIEASVPKKLASASIKWGMPMWTVNNEMLCALRVTKKHVSLLMRGSPEIFDDPEGLLGGEAKEGRQLKVTSVTEIPKKQVAGWIKAAVKNAAS